MARPRRNRTKTRHYWRQLRRKELVHFGKRATRSSADKPRFGASRSRPSFDQQIGLEGRSMPEHLFGCPSRSSADKPVFGASRSRPSFDQQIGLEGRSMPEHLFGCPSRSSAEKPVFRASRMRPNFFQQRAP